VKATIFQKKFPDLKNPKVNDTRNNTIGIDVGYKVHISPKNKPFTIITNETNELSRR
jgi:hypothetical protein